MSDNIGCLPQAENLQLHEIFTDDQNSCLREAACRHSAGWTDESFIDRPDRKTVSFVDRLDRKTVSFIDRLDRKTVSFVDRLDRKTVSFLDRLDREKYPFSTG